MPAEPAMHVFTYGSLMFPEVWKRVTGGGHRSQPALLAGHARYQVPGADYPGMVAQDGAQVEGVLYFDVAPSAVAALDRFEGGEYARRPVQVRCAAGAAVEAAAYLYLLPQNLSELPWRPQAFALARFMRMHCG